MDLRAQWQARNLNGVTERIEIYLPDYSGSVLSLDAAGEPFRFRHEEVTRDQVDGVLNPYANPIQRGTLIFRPLIRSTTEQQILDDILGNARTLLVYKLDGDVFWKGYVDTKRIQYPETPFFFADFTTTDLDNLTMDYPLEAAEGRAPLSEVIAELLGYLSFDLPIEAVTALSYDTFNKNESFLHQVFVDKSNLRNFGNPGEIDTPISVKQALEKLTKGLILRQMGGRFQIHQIRGFKNPDAVQVTTYDSEGKNPSTQIRDLRQNMETGNLPVFTESSGNTIYPGIRRSKIKFDHRTIIQNINFPDVFRLDDQEPQRTFTQFINSDGNQSLRLTGLADAQFDDDITEADLRVEIEADGLWWNGDAGQWQSSFFAAELEMTDTFLSEGKIGFQRSIDITTGDIPDSVSGDLNITLYTARDGSAQIFADFTDFTGLQLSVQNPTVEEGNNTAIEYQLTQIDTDHKEVLDLNTAWFGDGPTSYARSAFTLNESGTQLTTNEWGYQTYDKDFFEAILKEPLDLQRNNTRKFVGNSPRNYNPLRVSVYRGRNLYYVGGSYTGREGIWRPIVYQVNENTAEDLYEVIYKTYDPETGNRTVGGDTGGPSGPPPSGSGITQVEADQRYLIKAENLADLTNRPLARTEIGLGVDNDVEFRDLVARAGQFLLPVIVPDATLDSHALNRQTADGRYDKYNFWHLKAGEAAPEEIGKEDQVEFLEGSGISITFDSANKAVTIAATGSSDNNFLSGIEYIGDQGDDIEVRFNRQGLSPIDFDFKPFVEAWADTRYLTSEQDPTVPQFVKDISQSDINSWNAKDNYNHWKAQVNGGIHEEIGSGESVNFVAGDNITLDFSLSGGASITINSTATSTNNFLSSIEYVGDQGDDVEVRFNRQGLSAINFDFRPFIQSWADTRYLTSEEDPTVPQFVKDISQSDINSWNAKDNYNHWKVQVDGGIHEEIGSGESVNFVAGDNITLDFGLSGGASVTINATGASTNNYVSGIQFGGQEGDNIILELPRQGLSTLSLNMTGHIESYFDTVYAPISHNQPFSTITGTLSDGQHGSRGGGNLHSNATTSVAGFMSSADKSKLNGIASNADNYNQWQLQANSDPSISVGSGQMVSFVAGTNINISRSTRTITITATGDTTNNYVSGMDFGGTEGDDIVLRLQRQGLSQLTLNMTNHMRAYFDTIYESAGVSFSGIGGTLSDNQHGSRGGGNLHSNATTSNAGFMSSADKSKLNNIESGADNYDRWRVSFGGSTAWINSGQTMRMNAGTGLNWGSSDDNGRTRTISISNIVARRDQNNTFDGELTSDDYGISSDRRLKSDIDYRFSGSSLIKKMNFASFRKKGRFGYGVIAQELRMLLPESVKQNPNGYLSVYNNDLIAINGKAIQELLSRIDDLERQLHGNTE